MTTYTRTGAPPSRELDELVVRYGRGETPDAFRTLRPLTPDEFGFAKQAVKPLTTFSSLLSAADPMHYLDYAALPLGLARRWGERVQANIDARERAGQQTGRLGTGIAAGAQVIAGLGLPWQGGLASAPLLTDKNDDGLGWVLQEGAKRVGRLEQQLVRAAKARFGSPAERAGLRGRLR